VKRKPQRPGTTYRNLQWWAIRRRSATEAEASLSKAEALVAALPPELMEVGQAILRAAWYAGGWAERARQARRLADAKLGELCGRQGGQGKRRRSIVPESDLAKLSTMRGAQRAKALAAIAFDNGVKSPSVRKAVERWSKAANRT